MESKYKISNEKRNYSTFLYENEIKQLIFLTHKRNKKLCEVLIEIYEHLEGVKFDRTILKGKYSQTRK
jgi:hypothetical protein